MSTSTRRCLDRGLEDADLLILGNRGLHGINLLHSVSERVGHLGALLGARTARTGDSAATTSQTRYQTSMSKKTR